MISPLLANVYLHEVLDAWFERTVKPRLQGRAFLIRYADDAVMVFAREDDARRVLDVLPKRFAKYGLTLHPEKTRLVAFRPPRGRAALAVAVRPGRGTFDLLGFTHFWGRSRKGNWVVRRKTARDRFSRALRAIRRLVPRAPAPAASAAVAGARPEAAWALRLLRDHRQHAGALALPGRGRPGLAASGCQRRSRARPASPGRAGRCWNGCTRCRSGTSLRPRVANP